MFTLLPVATTLLLLLPELGQLSTAKTSGLSSLKLCVVKFCKRLLEMLSKAVYAQNKN